MQSSLAAGRSKPSAGFVWRWANEIRVDRVAKVAPWMRHPKPLEAREALGPF